MAECYELLNGLLLGVEAQMSHTSISYSPQSLVLSGMNALILKKLERGQNVARGSVNTRYCIFHEIAVTKSKAETL